MNLFLMLVSIIATGLIAKFSNEIPDYTAAIFLIIAMSPAGVAVVRSEYRDMELEDRIKALEDKKEEDE